MYASKLFPGVFFNKPIDLSFHKEKSADFTKKKNANDGLSRAFEYYSSFLKKDQRNSSKHLFKNMKIYNDK